MTIVHKSIAATAGNVDGDITAGSGEQYKLLYGQVILTTDATVANRRVLIQILDENDDLVIDFHSGAVVTASTSNQHHSIMPGVFRESAFNGNSLQLPIAKEASIPAGWKYRVTIENGVAGDSYTFEAAVETTHEGAKV